jgi:hypothetical protein
MNLLLFDKDKHEPMRGYTFILLGRFMGLFQSPLASPPQRRQGKTQVLRRIVLLERIVEFNQLHCLHN